MQLKLIVIIIISIGVTLFALQSVEPVTVSLAIWHFDGSLSLVLLIVFGLGVLIAERDERIAALNAVRSDMTAGSSAGFANASNKPNIAPVDQSHD